MDGYDRSQSYPYAPTTSRPCKHFIHVPPNEAKVGDVLAPNSAETTGEGANKQVPGLPKEKQPHFGAQKLLACYYQLQTQV
jgi:hypothetical protein